MRRFQELPRKRKNQRAVPGRSIQSGQPPLLEQPGTTINDLANFGIITTKGGQRRIMQLGLKLIF